MGELKEYIEIVKSATLIEQSNKLHPRFSSIFHFPNSNDYIDWINGQFEEFPSRGRRWVDLYREIIALQMSPYGLTLPEKWRKNIISYPTNCLYVIADENESILYIGKSEYPAITRILDRMIPAESEDYPKGQKMNNIPEIWEEFLMQGKSLKYFFCYDLDFNPEILEYYILFEYQRKNGRLPRYNKKVPNRSALPKSKEIIALIEPKAIPAISQNLKENKGIISNIEEALNQTMGVQYCPVCLKKPRIRNSIIGRYSQLISNQEIPNNVKGIYDTLVLDNQLIENYLLWDAKHFTIDIYSKEVYNENGDEIPFFKKDEIYEMYLREFEKTEINTKLGRCGCSIDI